MNLWQGDWTGIVSSDRFLHHIHVNLLRINLSDFISSLAQTDTYIPVWVWNTLYWCACGDLFHHRSIQVIRIGLTLSHGEQICESELVLARFIRIAPSVTMIGVSMSSELVRQPGYLKRHLDQDAVAAIRLYALREDDDSNYRREWRCRTQFLGSVLLWGFRAGAARIEYSTNSDEAFVYTDSNGGSVQSEFPQPPDGLRDGMIESLLIDTIDGHPISRPIRRFVRRWLRATARGKLTVPDSDNEIESEWSLVVDGPSAAFKLLGSSSAHRRNS